MVLGVVCGSQSQVKRLIPVAYGVTIVVFLASSPPSWLKGIAYDPNMLPKGSFWTTVIDRVKLAEVSRLIVCTYILYIVGHRVHCMADICICCRHCVQHPPPHNRTLFKHFQKLVGDTKHGQPQGCPTITGQISI